MSIENAEIHDIVLYPNGEPIQRSADIASEEEVRYLVAKSYPRF